MSCGGSCYGLWLILLEAPIVDFVLFLYGSVADPKRFDADPDPTFQADADPEPDPDPNFVKLGREKLVSSTS